MDTFFFEILLAALGIGPQRVATINDDVPGFQQGDELLDHGIHRRAGFHHDLGLAGAGEGRDELLKRLGWQDIFALGPGVGEFFRDGCGPVINADAKALAFHVENEILAHDGKSDKSDVALAHIK